MLGPEESPLSLLNGFINAFPAAIPKDESLSDSEHYLAFETDPPIFALQGVTQGQH